MEWRKKLIILDQSHHSFQKVRWALLFLIFPNWMDSEWVRPQSTFVERSVVSTTTKKSLDAPVDSRFSYTTRWRICNGSKLNTIYHNLRFLAILTIFHSVEFRTPISHTIQLLMLTECLYGLMISLEIVAGQRHPWTTSQRKVFMKPNRMDEKKLFNSIYATACMPVRSHHSSEIKWIISNVLNRNIYLK